MHNKTSGKRGYFFLTKTCTLFPSATTPSGAYAPLSRTIFIRVKAPCSAKALTNVYAWNGVHYEKHVHGMFASHKRFIVWNPGTLCLS